MGRGGEGAYEVEIKIVGPETLEGFVEGLLDVLGLAGVVPELAGEEDLGARDAGGFDALADFGLVVVDGGGVTGGSSAPHGERDGHSREGLTCDDNQPSVPIRRHS